MTARPEIEYPCRWSYRVIGADAAALRAEVEALVDGAEFTLEPSHTSATGKYTSLILMVVVRDETHRLELGERLRTAASVRYVL